MKQCLYLISGVCSKAYCRLWYRFRHPPSRGLELLTESWSSQKNEKNFEYNENNCINSQNRHMWCINEITTFNMSKCFNKRKLQLENPNEQKYFHLRACYFINASHMSVLKQYIRIHYTQIIFIFFLMINSWLIILKPLEGGWRKRYHNLQYAFEQTPLMKYMHCFKSLKHWSYKDDNPSSTPLSQRSRSFSFRKLKPFIITGGRVVLSVDPSA